MKRSAAGVGAAQSVLTDMRENDSTGIVPGLTTSPAYDAGGSRRPLNNQNSWFSTGSGSGTGGFMLRSFTDRGVTLRSQSPTNGQAAVGAAEWGMPFWRDITKFPTTYRPARQFIMSMCVQRFGVPNAGSTYNIGIRRQIGQLSGSIAGNGMSGIEVISDPGINGGNWTPRHMKVPIAGPLVQGSDSGFSAVTPVRIDFIYNEVGPTISIRINKVLCLLLTGIASMPLPNPAALPIDVGLSSQQMFASVVSDGTALGGAAGQYDECWDMRFRIFQVLDSD